MNADKAFNLLGAIVTVALVTTLVARKNTASVVTAFGDAFSNSISAALGAGAKIS